MRNEAVPSSSSDFASSSETEKLIDDAIDRLGERDRNAVLLRFFGGRSLREVGEILGVSEEAARQRVFRSVEKLRAYFKSKGVTAETASISACLGMAVKPAGTELAKAAIRLGAGKCAAASTISSPGILSHVGALWVKLTAGLVAAGTVAAAVVVITHAATPPVQMPAQPPPAHITATPLLADITPAIATQPSDQATPVDTLKKLSAAVQEDDRQAIADCLCDDGVDPDAAATAQAFFLQQAAVWHLQSAWKSKFGAEMKTPGLGFDDFPGHGTFEAVLIRILDFPAGLEATIDGDTAQVRIPLPREAFISPGANQITALAHWSGAMLVFKQVNGDWKLDTDRTFNFVVGEARYPGNNNTDLAIIQKVTAEVADSLDAVAADIDSGKLTTRQSAISRIEAAAHRAFRDARVDGTTIMTLPLIGG